MGLHLKCCCISKVSSVKGRFSLRPEFSWHCTVANYSVPGSNESKLSTSSILPYQCLKQEQGFSALLPGYRNSSKVSGIVMSVVLAIPMNCVKLLSLSDLVICIL